MVKKLLWSLLIAVCPSISVAEAETEVKITARDASGVPIEKFEAMLAVGEQQHTAWSNAKQGIVHFRHYDVVMRQPGAEKRTIPAAELFVRANGYATASMPFTLSDGLTEVEIPLQEGRVISLQFHDSAGRAIPADLEPLFFPREYRKLGLFLWQRKETDASNRRLQDANWYMLRRTDSGSYEFRVTEETPELFLNIDDRDFLRAFETGPLKFPANQDSPLVVTLPEPASLSVQLKLRSTSESENPPIASTNISVSRPKDEGSNQHFPISMETLSEPYNAYSLRFIAPGQLHLVLSTTSKNEVRYGDTDPGNFRDGGALELQAGEQRQIVYSYERYKSRPFDGDREVLIHVLTPNGEPVGESRFKVEFADKHFGTFTVKEGVVQNGRIHLEGILPTSDLEFPQRYELTVNQRRLGNFSVSANSEEVQIERYRLALDVGDNAIPITARKITNGEPASIDFAGKVTLIEFWATWCGPCQEPMQKLNLLAANNASRWHDRVQLFAVSIDDSSEVAKRHLEARGWLNTENLIDEPGQNAGVVKSGFDAKSARDYTIQGVPTAILIGPSGF